MVVSFVDVNLEIVVRLLLAMFFGAMIGVEREISHKPAGLRTHMLVCLGSALFTAVSVYTFGQDPARIVASIVTGMGFIGAGTIIASRGQVHGITTASSLWTTAGIGLVVAVGGYFLAAVVTLMVFAILNLRRIEKNFEKKM